LHALAATICAPQAVPVIAGTRLRGGSAASARGATGFTAEAVGTAPGFRGFVLPGQHWARG